MQEKTFLNIINIPRRKSSPTELMENFESEFKGKIIIEDEHYVLDISDNKDLDKLFKRVIENYNKVLETYEYDAIFTHKSWSYSIPISRATADIFKEGKQMRIIIETDSSMLALYE